MPYSPRPGGIFNWRANEADALTALGRLEEADAALREFEGALSVAPIPSALLMLARCEGNLATATGDHSRAESSFLRGHAIAPGVPMPFELALLHLDDGRRLRQLGRQPDADELELLQVAAAPDSPEVLLGLSRAEMAVARLVATGLTNREVAAELYVSVKTVEYHLRNSFIKLDITSRRQLASLLR